MTNIPLKQAQHIDARPAGPVSNNSGQIIGQSLSRLSSAIGGIVEEQTRELEQKARFDANLGLTRLTREAAIKLDEMQGEAPADGAGLAGGFAQYADDAVQKYLKGLPPALQQEYAAQAATRVNPYLIGAHGAERKLRNGYFTRELQSERDTMAAEVMAGRLNLAAAQEQFGAAVMASALPDGDKRELAIDADRYFQRAGAEKNFRDVVLNGGRTTGGPADGSDVVAALVPGPLRALLNYIGTRESPGGAYNIRYDGGKGAEFSDYSKHPNVRVTTPDGKVSTAAGRYQFTYETWKWVQENSGLNLPDFSPESQDRAAAWLAVKRYALNTGRDLIADLVSGDPAVLAGVKENLAGTWEIFAKDGTAKFASEFSAVGVQATAPQGFPDYYSDPDYADLTISEKVALSNRALAFEEEQRTNAQRAENAAREARFEERRLQVSLGEVPAIDLIAERDQWTPKEFRQLVDAAEPAVQAKVRNAATAQRLAAGDTFLIGDAEDQERIDTFVDPKLVREGDVQALGAFIKIARDHGIIARPALTEIVRMTRGQAGLENQRTAYGLLAMMRQHGPTAMLLNSMLDDQTKGLLDRYETLLEYQGEAAANAAINLSPPDMAQIEQINKLVDSEFSDASEWIESLQSNVIDEMAGGAEGWFTGGTLKGDPNLAVRMMGDYKKLVRAGYQLSAGDKNFALEYARKRLLERWGPSPISYDGSWRVVYAPPQHAGYQPITGKLTPDYYAGERDRRGNPVKKTDYFEGWDWLEHQIRADFGIAEDVEVNLVGDEVTRAEVEQWKKGKLLDAEGRPRLPSYIVTQMDDTGQMVALLAPKTNQLARWYGRPQVYQENMVAATKIGLRQERGKEFRQSAAMNEAWKNTNDVAGAVAGALEYAGWTLLAPNSKENLQYLGGVVKEAFSENAPPRPNRKLRGQRAKNRE